MSAPNDTSAEVEGFYIHRRLIKPDDIVDVKEMTDEQKQAAGSRALKCDGMGFTPWPHARPKYILTARDPDGGKSQDGKGHMYGYCCVRCAEYIRTRPT